MKKPMSLGWDGHIFSNVMRPHAFAQTLGWKHGEGIAFMIWCGYCVHLGLARAEEASNQGLSSSALKSSKRKQGSREAKDGTASPTHYQLLLRLPYWVVCNTKQRRRVFCMTVEDILASTRRISSASTNALDPM